MLALSGPFIFPPIKLGYCKMDGKVNERHLSFYRQLDEALSAITLEPLYMDKGLRELPSQLGIDDDDKLEGLQQLIDQLHRKDTKVIAHLNHPGRMANPMLQDNFFWSSSEKVCENGGQSPLAMNRAMMNEVRDLFIDGVRRAEKAGFDIIEIQFGHGYLMAQFLSPMVNVRSDEYGGTMKNRFRFPLEIAKAIREEVALPLIARISGDEMTENGYHLGESIQFARELENIGFDAIHVSAGSVCSTPPWFFQHMFIPKGKTWDMAAKIQSEISLPVIYVGQINSFEDIDLLKTNYQATYMAVGRACLADPLFVTKYLDRSIGEPRPCMSCAEGCLGGVKSGKGLGCVINPTLNNPVSVRVERVEASTFAVIGAGLAGMQAAITLNDRGHRVDLFEKDRLGGQFNLAYLPPKKSGFRKMLNYFEQELTMRFDKGIRLIKREARAEDIKKGAYQAVIMATGALPQTAPIKGLKEYYWTEFLQDDQLPKEEKVLVIGGGLIGLEVASKLVDADNEVLIVEMKKELAEGMEMIEKKMTINKLKSKKTKFFTEHSVGEIVGDRIRLEGPDGWKEIRGIDRVVMTTGMKSYLPFEVQMDLPVHVIGDAKQVAKAADAIRDGYEIGTQY